MENTETQRFKIVLPILKTRVEIRKDAQGNEREVRFVEGVASSTDKDLHGDKMAPSAIKSMAESLKYHEVPLNADHDTTWSAEIGPIKKLEVTEDNDLVLEAELSEMSKANDLWYALTKQNKKLGLSIGGYVKEYEMVKEEEKDEDGNATGEAHWYRLYKDIDLDHVAVTSSPANPKTWVSAISKSIDPKRDLELIKMADAKKSEATTTVEKRRSRQDIRNLAHKIARKVQDVEANLLLELTESFLFKMSNRQLDKIEKYLELFNERNMSMDKKDVSLEADKAKELADALEKDENSAALENESSEDTSKDGGSEPAKPETEAEPAKPEEGEDDAKDEATEATETNEESTGDDASDDKADDDKSDDGEDKADDEESGEKPAPAEGEKSETESTEKSADGSLVEVVKSLTENLKAVVKSNEELAKKVAVLESQPADRKTVEISKTVGDDDSAEEESAEDLQKAMEKEIADLKVKHASDPALFSLIQKARVKYAQKAKGI